MIDIKHEYKIYEDKNTLFIYVSYPDEYEFGLDFSKLKENVKNVSNKIREYAFKNIGSVSNKTALLVLNGVVVGSILLTNLNAKNIKKKEDKLFDSKEVISANVLDETNNAMINEENSYYKENITDEKNNTKNKYLDITNINSSISKNNNNIVTQNTTSTKKNDSTTNINTVQKTTNIESSIPVNVQNINTPNNTNENVSTSPSNIESKEENTTKVEQNISTPAEQMVNVKLNSGEIISIALEKYVIGVVGSEMPASFNIEALKAQAVAARTYALKRIASGNILTATTSTQVYKQDSELQAMWGSNFNTYYTKVSNAVNATKGQYMTYNGKYIDALYFSTSNGKTEDPIYVYGTEYPYLKSVDSSVDLNVKSFSYTKTMTLSEFNQKLGTNISNTSEISILSKTSGDRINEIKIGDKTFTGVKVRSLLSLRSADFNITIDDQTVTISTKGFGHGCGMSQYGANEMAKQGKSYIQILNHYYTNIQISS